MRPNRATLALAAYGLLNGALYSVLLPLWEGFDEPFHYGYVQTLSTGGGLPVLSRTALSGEITASLKLAPASHVVRQNLPQVPVYSDFFAMRPEERAQRRAALETLAPSLRFAPAGEIGNYEAHQAPLAYLLLAIPDRLWADAPLLARIRMMRALCAAASVLLMAAGVPLLARLLAVPGPFAHTALFLLFSTQMFYACAARVSNDWLAIPLTVFLFAAAVAFHQKPEPKTGAALASALALGLLTKAYFLAFAPFASGVVLWAVHRRKTRWRTAAGLAAIVAAAAGPWYLRNVALYGNLSGMQEATGVGLRGVLEAFFRVPWPRSILTIAQGMLWTGNNSFTTFSAATIDAALAGLLAAAGLGLRAAPGPRRGSERVVAAGCLAFAAALAYSTALSFAYTKGAAFATSRWYAEPLLAPLLCLLFAGLSRSGRAGAWLAAGLTALCAYLLGATYVAKLIPLYGGYAGGRTTLSGLAGWYLRDGGRTREILGNTCLAGPAAIYSLTGAAVAAAVVLAAWTIRQVTARGSQPPLR